MRGLLGKAPRWTSPENLLALSSWNHPPIGVIESSVGTMVCLFDYGMLIPVEAAAEDSFDDEMVSGSGGADADAEVDLPLG